MRIFSSTMSEDLEITVKLLLPTGEEYFIGTSREISLHVQKLLLQFGTVGYQIVSEGVNLNLLEANLEANN